MKKFWIAFAIALIAIAIVAAPALAWGGTDAEVNCSDIEVDGITPNPSEPPTGTTITFSGTVDITATAAKKGLIVYAYAYSSAWYSITDPNGVVIYNGSQDYDDSDYAFWGCATADASQTYNWSQDVYIDLIGDYVAEHGGEAYAENGNQFLCWRWPDSTSYDSCSTSRTVNAHAASLALAGMVRPILYIQLPSGLVVEARDHLGTFFASDGWNDPTTKDITYTDGIWQVDIDAGTILQLDGAWHTITWIEVDDKGNVIGRYGADGQIIAEEIGLSQPITVTKVG